VKKTRKLTELKKIPAREKSTAKKLKPAGDPKEPNEVAIDRRGSNHNSRDRRSDDRRKEGAPVEVERRKLERRVKVNRRRQIDPTTCERDYSDEEVEFMNAIEEYKRTSGRMFPTCSEILEVLRALGYAKLPPVTPAAPITAVAPAAAELPSAQTASAV